jgi:hypothetical protein
LNEITELENMVVISNKSDLETMSNMWPENKQTSNKQSKQINTMMVDTDCYINDQNPSSEEAKVKGFKNRRMKMRKKKIFQETSNISVKLVKTTTHQRDRTGRFLRAKDVDNKLVQDKSSNIVLVGSDVEALYPSLQDIQTANIIFRAIMETEIGFEGVHFQEAVRYIVLNTTEVECRRGELRRVLPWRRHTNGVRPGCGDQEQWEFPNVELSKRDKRLVIATVMKIAVLVLFRTHVYTFGGDFFCKKQGGPIGLRSTCTIARIVMLWWDVKWLDMMATSNLTLEERIRYTDDLRAWLYSVRLGWRWQGGQLLFSSGWRKEEMQKGMTGLQKTVVLCGMMNDVCGFLKMTMESADDFPDKTTYP